MGVETALNSELAEFEGFADSDKSRFSEEVLGWWIQGEDVETFPKTLFKMVETWIIRSDKRRVMGSWEGAGIRVWMMEGLGWKFLEKGE